MAALGDGSTRTFLVDYRPQASGLARGALDGGGNRAGWPAARLVTGQPGRFWSTIDHRHPGWPAARESIRVGELACSAGSALSGFERVKK